MSGTENVDGDAEAFEAVNISTSNAVGGGRRRSSLISGDVFHQDISEAVTNLEIGTNCA